MKKDEACWLWWFKWFLLAKSQDKVQDPTDKTLFSGTLEENKKQQELSLNVSQEKIKTSSWNCASVLCVCTCWRSSYECNSIVNDFQFCRGWDAEGKITPNAPHSLFSNVGSKGVPQLSMLAKTFFFFNYWTIALALFWQVLLVPGLARRVRGRQNPGPHGPDSLASTWVPNQWEILTESNEVDGAWEARAEVDLCVYGCMCARETAYTTTCTNDLEERLTKSEDQKY